MPTRQPHLTGRVDAFRTIPVRRKRHGWRRRTDRRAAEGTPHGRAAKLPHTVFCRSAECLLTIGNRFAFAIPNPPLTTVSPPAVARPLLEEQKRPVMLTDRNRSAFPTTSVVTATLSAVCLTGMVAAPAAEASTTSITAQTAGTKAVSATTNVWGVASGAPAGTRICDQVLLSSGWSTSQCSTTTATGYYQIPLTYGINTPGTYTFRVTAQGVYSPNVTLKRTSTVPDYTKGRTTSGYTLSSGYNGVKVYLVQRALGMPYSPMASTMGPTTTSNVKAFQTSRKLPATGVVDANTFYALMDSKGWSYRFNVDSWQQPSTVAAGASRSTRVAAAVQWARNRLGKRYVWGGTGWDTLGYDCSGLLLQALRAGGYNPRNVGNANDVVPPSTLSAAMWNDAEFPKGSLSRPQYGDLVYYGNSSGGVGHVSMYIGNNTVISAHGSSVQYASYSSTLGWYKKIGINRMP